MHGDGAVGAKPPRQDHLAHGSSEHNWNVLPDGGEAREERGAQGVPREEFVAYE